MNFLKRLIHAAGGWYIKSILWKEYDRQKVDSRGPNERPLEYSFALNALSISRYQDILDVGPGLSAWPAILSGCGYHVTAIDEMSMYWKGQILNRHFHVFHDDITAPNIKKTFGIITCLSALEHIPAHVEAVAAMATLLKEQGILILTFPYNEKRYTQNVYELPEAGYGRDAPYICQVFDRGTLNEWVKNTGLSLVRQHFYRAFTGELWTFGKRIHPMQEVSADELHHLTGIVLQKTG